MKPHYILADPLLVLIAAVVLSAGATTAGATEPCGDFGECKVLVETNSSDGDIGFHFKMDGDDLIAARMYNPNWRKLFAYRTRRELRHQFLTETFAESAEPLCFDPLGDDDPDNDDEDFVTLEDFLDRWTAGMYHFIGISDGWEISLGHTPLTFDLPAAPADVDFVLEEDNGDIEGEISWSPGDDLGECADHDELSDLVADGMLPTHPEDVEVVSWEVVLEPEFEADDPNATKGLVFVNHIGADELELEDGVFEVEVPDDYLASLPDDTLVKVEVGAIGGEDNATFTEEGEWCVNEVDGCEE